MRFAIFFDRLEIVQQAGGKGGRESEGEQGDRPPGGLDELESDSVAYSHGWFPYPMRAAASMIRSS
jgi:hypothetical protein